MWQEIITGCIGVAVILYIGRKIYNYIFLRSAKQGYNCSCKGCPLQKKDICKKRVCHE